MRERAEHSPNQEDIVVEIGPGYSHDTNMFVRSLDVQERVARGGLYIVLDRDEHNLGYIREGAGKKMDITEFAESDYLDGTVRTMFIFNVFGDTFSRVSGKSDVEQLLPGLERKLTPDGHIIIGENYTPRQAYFLKDINYNEYDLSSTRYEGEQYRKRLGELRLTVQHIDSSPDHGEPFIIELQKKS